MNLTRIVTDLGDAAEWVAVVSTLVFLVQYTIRAKWWNNFVGRSVVLLDACLMAILIPAVIQDADPALGARWFSSFTYLVVLASVLWVIALVGLTRIWGWHKVAKARKAINGSRLQ